MFTRSLLLHGMQILPLHFLVTLNEAWLNEFVFVSQLQSVEFPSSKIPLGLMDPVWGCVLAVVHVCICQFVYCTYWCIQSTVHVFSTLRIQVYLQTKRSVESCKINLGKLQPVPRENTGKRFFSPCFSTPSSPNPCCA